MKSLKITSKRKDYLYRAITECIENIHNGYNHDDNFDEEGNMIKPKYTKQDKKDIDYLDKLFAVIARL